MWREKVRAMNPIQDILPLLEDPAAIDLDALQNSLHSAIRAWDEREQLLGMYEHELQKELRAKSDLCGGIPTCATPDDAFSLSGPALLAARREASLRFNELFMNAPVSRTAQKSNYSEAHARASYTNTLERQRN